MFGNSVVHNERNIIVWGYNYYPSIEQVRAWLEQAGPTIEENGTGSGYEHFIVRK